MWGERDSDAQPRKQLLVTGSYLVKMLCSTEYPTDMYNGYMALWYHYLRGFGRCGLLLGLVGGLANVNLMLAPGWREH